MMKKATQQQAWAVTSVFWDIKTYPVPPDCDARVVGPCIKRYLKNLGYSGRLTIFAISPLTDVSDDVLAAVYSTGIYLNHVSLGFRGILGTMYGWASSYPPPANIILISSNPSVYPDIFPRLHSRGYNILQLFPYDSPKAESLWKAFLLEESGALKEDKFSGTGDSAYWLCSLCSDLLCKGFENFTTHLSSQEHKHKATQLDKEAVAVTSVLWDIRRCPVPPGCDARRVGPCIKEFLEYLGYSGPLTINAFGPLTDVTVDILRAVSSTGIVLNHVDFNSADILHVMYLWANLNPPPSNVMVICPYSEDFAKALTFLQESGYSIIDPFSFGSPYSESLWKNFLLADSGTLEEDKCSETGEHASWVCLVCDDIRGKGFENFTTHLSSHEHDNKLTQIDEGVVAVTLVFWDIKRFPVPPGCDARWVSLCIKRFLKKLGYSGPLTIFAVGLLTDVPDKILRAVSSTGIVLNHVPFGFKGIVETMFRTTNSYPPPANMMLISSNPSIYPEIYPRLHSQGYNILQLFPYDSPKAESLWKAFLLEESGALKEDKFSGTGDFAYWLCSLCSDVICKGFENFTTHLSSQEHEHKATQLDEEAVVVTSVLWDIRRCPVPPGCDARRVGPCIKQFLENLGYSGPPTINAFGPLTDVTVDILRAVSSTGIVLNHIDFNSSDILHVLYLWTDLNPPPANVMVIYPYSEDFAEALVFLQELGYSIIKPFHGSPYSESLWRNFLLEDSGTLAEDKCSETGEHASWVCFVCDVIRGLGLENFTTHLSSQEHKHKLILIDEEAVVVTSVFWDIKGFPVPPDYDARWVGPCIERYLEDFGYPGPLTINAVGLLSDVPVDILQAVSSTGIVLNHIALNSVDSIYQWTYLNPPPANIIVIWPSSEAFTKDVCDLEKLGYNIIQLFPYDSPVSESSRWKNFLLEGSVTLDKEKCSEMCEQTSWVCSVCDDIPGKGFENFTTHLSSQEHKDKMLMETLCVHVGDLVKVDSPIDECHEKYMEPVETGVEVTIGKEAN